MRIVLTMCVLYATAGVVDAAEKAITPAEMTSWQIVCEAGAIESERYAASEFQTLFAEMTGHTLTIVAKPTPGTASIFIGPDAVAASGCSPAPETLGQEGLRIGITESSICIDGGRPRGTLYGVYEFFEEYCGTRYLTHDHTHFPPGAASRNIPFSERTHHPHFAFRWSYYGETNRNPAFAARLHTNTVAGDAKLGGITGYRLVGHNVANLAPPSKYGEEHPEYYALVDGLRKIDMHGGGPQLCMTNADVLDIVVDAVLEEIEKNPSARNINVAHMDNEGYCTCDDCAAIDAREESHAGATLAFVNAVAERVEKTHPDVLIGTYAYQFTRRPPKNISARNNVMIQLCSIECCDFHAIDDPNCSLNRTFCEDMAGWKDRAEHIFVWHYNTNFKGYMLPFPNFRAIGASVDYFAKNNGRGVFMQAAGNGFSTELSDLRNYVMSRCLWKPGRSSWDEAQEFCRLHYAESAQPILDYLTYYHDLVGASGLHPICFPTESSLSINRDSARRIMAYFEEALALAKTDAVRARVEKASLCGLRAALSASTMRLEYDNGVCRPSPNGLTSGLLERYAALCEKYGVSMDNEQTPASTYLAEMTKLYAGMKAVKIENDTWRVVLLPESNAKVVDMTYKPTGRNILQPARSLDRFRYEEWVRQGEGPRGHIILPHEARVGGDTAFITLVTADGTRFERTITLDGDTVRFETMMTAKAPRAFDITVHPEYDAATTSTDPNVLSVYVKQPQWIHANKDWIDARPTETQTALVRDAVCGGHIAYFNHQVGFGIEQRFAPENYESLALYWSPDRIQINLDMNSRIVSLKQGEQARCSYEVRYLDAPPIQP